MLRPAPTFAVPSSMLKPESTQCSALPGSPSGKCAVSAGKCAVSAGNLARPAPFWGAAPFACPFASGHFPRQWTYPSGTRDVGSGLMQTLSWKSPRGVGVRRLALQPDGIDGSPRIGGDHHGQMGTVSGPPWRYDRGGATHQNPL